MSKTNMSVCLATVLALVLTGPAFAEMTCIAVWTDPFFGYFPCGDVNRNGHSEIYGTAYIRDTMVIYEHEEGNQFRCKRTNTLVHRVLDLGEGDGDTLPDLLANPSISTLRVFESVAPDTFPSVPVWETNVPGNVKCARFVDLDRDGLNEIVVTGLNTSGFYVYKSTGNNQYEEVPFPHIPGDAEQDFADGDFDGDSLMELVAGNSEGVLFVYEYAGNGQYARVCSLSFYPELIENWRHTAARDMDRNGKPEFISLFRIWRPGDSCLIRVYEEPVHGQLDCTWEYRSTGSMLDGSAVASGDVDGDGIDEFVVCTGRELLLFRCSDPRSYRLSWQYPAGSIRQLRLYDLNDDGRDELIFPYRGLTYVFEDTTGLSPIAEYTNRYRPPLPRVQPTVSTRGAPVLFGDLVAGSTVIVCNSFGAVIRSEPAVAQRQWRWDLTDNRGQTVPTGTYFAAVRSCGQSSRVKLCIVK